MTTWPAILKYHGDDELTYISSMEEWNADSHLHSFKYDSLDKMIDSAGLIHELSESRDNFISPKPTGETIELDRALAIVRLHFSAIGSCCSSKLMASSVAELVNLVGIEDADS